MYLPHGRETGGGGGGVGGEEEEGVEGVEEFGGV